MSPMHQRFRKFLPIVIDVETAGFDANRDALLELACIFLEIDDNKLNTTSQAHYHIIPFEGANLDPDALEFTKIDPYHPFRLAVSEKEALESLSDEINLKLAESKCTKAVLVAHNPWFDLSFIQSAAKRCNIKLPLHSFTTFDTATLGAAFYGQTVLAKILGKAKIPYDPELAHSALYDAEVTAKLFCKIINNI